LTRLCGAADDTEILGELDDVASVKTNYVISPFVALIPWPYPFRVDGNEVEEIIEVPVSALQTITKYFYPYQGRVIWGATARILSKFLEIYAQVMKGE